MNAWLKLDTHREEGNSSYKYDCLIIQTEIDKCKSTCMQMMDTFGQGLPGCYPVDTHRRGEGAQTLKWVSLNPSKYIRHCEHQVEVNITLESYLTMKSVFAVVWQRWVLQILTTECKQWPINTICTLSLSFVFIWLSPKKNYKEKAQLSHPCIFLQCCHWDCFYNFPSLYILEALICFLKVCDLQVRRPNMERWMVLIRKQHSSPALSLPMMLVVHLQKRNSFQNYLWFIS